MLCSKVMLKFTKLYYNDFSFSYALKLKSL